MRYSPCGLFANYFDQHPLPPPAIEFPVEYLLPGAEIELSFCHGNDDLPAHHLPLQVPIGIVFTNVVAILVNRFMGSDRFKPYIEIIMESWLIIVNKHRSSDMHGIHEGESLLDATLIEALLHLRRYVDIPSPRGYIEP